MSIHHSAPHDPASFVHHTHRRPLETNVQSCKHPHRCSPSFARGITSGKGRLPAGEQQPHVWDVLDKRPKTLLGLAIRARAERHLCRYLWTVDFERLPPSDQAARVVTACATLLSSRPCDRGEFRAQSKTPSGIAGRRDSVLGTTRGLSGLQPSRTPTALASSWRVLNRSARRPVI